MEQELAGRLKKHRRQLVTAFPSLEQTIDKGIAEDKKALGLLFGLNEFAFTFIPFFHQTLF